MRKSNLKLEIVSLMEALFGVELKDDRPVSREGVSKWDSIKHVELIFLLEDEYEVEFSEQEMSEIGDLDTIVSLIDAKSHHVA